MRNFRPPDPDLTPSEQQYRALAEALPQIVWTADAHGGLEYYNRRWFDYTGMSFEQTRGWGWKPVIHPDDLEPCITAWKYALANGTPYEFEHRFKRASDGSYRWHLGRALPVRDAQGMIVKWFGTATDIDDQRRSLEFAQRQAEQLAFIVEATDRFSASLDRQQSLETLCELVCGRFADWASVNVIEPDGRLRVAAIQHIDPSRAQTVAQLRGSYAADPHADGGVTSVIKSQTSAIFPEYSLQTLTGAIVADKRDVVARLGAGSTICVPLLVRGRVVAVMNAMWSQSDRRYHASEIPFFEELAKRSAVAFDEAVRHERALANEEITRRIMESSDDCIALLSLAGLVVNVNARFAAMPAALEAGRDWFDCWRPDDRAAAQAAVSRARGGSPGKFQGRLNGGSSRWWDTSVTAVYDAAGFPVELLAISRDVTRQKQHEADLSASEARYRAIANAIPHIAFTARVDGTLDFVNDRWIEFTGLSLAASTDYAHAAATHPDDREFVATKWFEAMRAGTAYETECRLRRAADGVYRWHLMRAVPIRDDGAIVQWFGTGTDIDDQKRVEAEIARARDEALHAANVKSQFVATMSHEIRTPISGVIGMTELLLLTPLSEEQREYVKVVSDSGQSLLRVINDILDFSKIDAGKLALESVEFDLPSQLKSVIDLLQTQAERKSIVMSASIDSNVPSSLIGDPGRLRQILLNLVGNAVKFTPDGGRVRVTASAGSVDDSQTVRFAVQDSGVGITPEVQQRLFEPFSQGDGSTTRRFGGTGLGLSICKQLVSLMSGSIGLESIPGEGSTFWFTIPFKRGSGQRSAAEMAANSQRERRAQSRARRPERVLLVEDNEVNLLLALQQFKHFGIEPTTATNGREAVDAIRRTDYDLVFMDCHMPEMNGFEATKAIRKLERQTATRLPIIAMTADALSEDRQACLAAGMDDYLSKPSSLANLAAVLARWLPESTPAT